MTQTRLCNIGHSTHNFVTRDGFGSETSAKALQETIFYTFRLALVWLPYYSSPLPTMLRRSPSAATLLKYRVERCICKTHRQRRSRVSSNSDVWIYLMLSCSALLYRYPNHWRRSSRPAPKDWAIEAFV